MMQPRQADAEAGGLLSPVLGTFEGEKITAISPERSAPRMVARKSEDTAADIPGPLGPGINIHMALSPREQDWPHQFRFSIGDKPAGAGFPPFAEAMRAVLNPGRARAADRLQRPALQERPAPVWAYPPLDECETDSPEGLKINEFTDVAEFIWRVFHIMAPCPKRAL